MSASFKIKRSELVKALSSCLICGEGRIEPLRQINIEWKHYKLLEFSASDGYRVVQHTVPIVGMSEYIEPFAIDYVEATNLYSWCWGYQKDVFDAFELNREEKWLATTVVDRKLRLRDFYSLPFTEGMHSDWAVPSNELREAVADRDQFLLKIDPDTGISTKKRKLNTKTNWARNGCEPVFLQRGLLREIFIGVRTRKYTTIRTAGPIEPVFIQARKNIKWNVMPYARPSDFAKTQDQVEDDEARCLRVRQGDGADGVTV